MITIHVTSNVDGATRKLDLMLDRLEDLQPVLKRFNRYFRKKVRGKFEAGGPGWEPLKEATAGRKLGEAETKQLALELVHRKLKRELKRAKLRTSARVIKTKAGVRVESASQAVARRYAVLKAFEASATGGGEYGDASTGDAILDKSLRGLVGRTQRAEVAASKRTLGKIASSIKSRFTKTDLTVESSIPWAGVHNKGGTAGHGAKIPKREFLVLDDEDVAMLVKLATDHLSP